MRKIYPALLQELENGVYVIRVPDVRGCITTGENLEDAFDSIQDALAGCLSALEEVGEPLPEPSGIKDIAEPDWFAALISVEFRSKDDPLTVQDFGLKPGFVLNNELDLEKFAQFMRYKAEHSTSEEAIALLEKTGMYDSEGHLKPEFR